MPGLDTDLVVHRLPIKPEARPVKQKLRRLKPEWADQSQAVGRWILGSDGISGVVGKHRACTQERRAGAYVCRYRDLNKASPKDDFPLPHIDVLVDNTATHSMFSFMDGFSGYNQIKMAPEDKQKTSFTTHWGTYCYKVMPFGLKNAGATYQRAMTALFHDMIHKEMEVYVDDMIAKSKEEEDHLVNLRKVFDRLRKYSLRLNSNKCVFGATSGKLLGFIVGKRGIEVDPVKVKAILEMPPPSTEKEVRGFLGRLQYISRFIAQMTPICEPIFKLLKKDNPE